MKTMTPEFDIRIADWLEDDPDKAPSIVLETVVGALPSIPQRRNWRSLLRTNQMPRFAIVAGVVLVAAIGFGGWWATRNGSVGATPAPIATPTAPTPEPTTQPTPESTPAASSMEPEATPGTLTGVNQFLPVSAGAYLVESPFDAPFTFTVTGSTWMPTRLEHNVLTLDRSSGDRLIASLGIFIPDSVYADPCHSEGGPTPIDTVDDLVAALTSMPGYTAGAVTDVALGGAPGKSFELRNAIDVEAESCAEASLKLATYDRFGTDETIFSGPGDVERYWVVDVAGKPVILQLNAAGTATTEEQSETEQTIESIAFE